MDRVVRIPELYAAGLHSTKIAQILPCMRDADGGPHRDPRRADGGGDSLAERGDLAPPGLLGHHGEGDVPGDARGEEAEEAAGVAEGRALRQVA